MNNILDVFRTNLQNRTITSLIFYTKHLLTQPKIALESLVALLLITLTGFERSSPRVRDCASCRGYSQDTSPTFKASLVESGPTGNKK